MGTVKYFEEFKIWQDARGLVGGIYAFTGGVRDYGFNDQIQRAAVSVMNNIAEGAEAGSVSMFKRFLLIAKGSCGEVRSMLYIASDLNYMEKLKVEKLQEKCKMLSVGIYNLLNYLDRKQD